MVDKTLILRKLAELDEYLEQIREYKDITIELYSKDWKTQRVVERTIQMMIEVCVDIAEHIIADRGYRIPTSYADTFRVLSEKDILSKELFNKLEKMARFRNIVVHNYDRIIGEIVIDILKRNLNDFLSYRDAIINLLKDEPNPPSL